MDTEDVFVKPTLLKPRAGGWKACSFLSVYAALELITYVGIGANLVIYLTNVLHEGTVNASKNVNYWTGVSLILPIVGAFFGDTYLGRYWCFVMFAFCYMLGLVLLNVTVWVPSLRPPPCGMVERCKKASNAQVGAFYLALYVTGIGAGVSRPNLAPIAGGQFDDSDVKEKDQKASFFNWWVFAGFLGSLFSQTVIVYVQDNVGFRWGYGIVAILYFIAISSFLVGTPFYRRAHQTSNPFLEMAQVFVAFVKKRRVTAPSDPTQLHELDQQVYASNGRTSLPNTSSLSCLDKAATKDDSEDEGPWSLCTVTQVEQTKMFIKIIPILLCNMVPNIMISQGNTLFVKQATTLDRKLGAGFDIPPASLGAFTTVPMLLSIIVYDRFAVRMLRKMTGKRRGITVLQRIGFGLGVQTVGMAVAAITESRRMHLVKEHSLFGNDKAILPVSVFMLAPQFIFFGISLALIEPGFIEFFYEEPPDSLKSTSFAFFFLSSGSGFFLSSFLLTAVHHISGGKWVHDNINSSSLHYYFALLTVLSFLNLVMFMVFSKRYACKKQI